MLLLRLFGLLPVSIGVWSVLAYFIIDFDTFTDGMLPEHVPATVSVPCLVMA